VKTALIIVDYQEDFYPALCPVEGVLELAEQVDVVIATQSAHPKNHPSFAEFGVHCIKGSKGARLHPAIKEVADYVPTKGRSTDEDYSAFEACTLRPLEWVEEILKVEGVGEVWVAGLGHRWDVVQTAFDANALGYPTTIWYEYAPIMNPETQARLERAGVTIR
jgi:nicotinamidase/pyrazinamidase